MSRYKNEKNVPPNPERTLSEVRQADPFFAREVAKYDFPLPSREYVQQVLTEQGVPLAAADLARLLDVSADEFFLFERRLRAMERDGQVLRNRRDAFILPDKANLIAGRISGHADGFGFLIRDDKAGPDLFLGPKDMREVLHGDRVLARVVGTDRRGRPEGRVVEILERANQRVVGRVRVEHGVFTVAPEDRRLAQDILVTPGGKKAQEGQIVTVELIEQPSRHSQPIGRIVEVLGNYADDGMEIEIALRKHAMPFEFSPEVKAEARKLPRKVRKLDRKGREDLTMLPLVTIDGETARDFDDAVYCEKQGRGFRLIVAIADVSHYVTPGSALDADAFDRGNSVYFPRRVIPMLPEKLSNGLCSLVPHEERLCMVCDMNLSATGAVQNYRFYRGVMLSHARLTYTQVAAALYEQDEQARAGLGELLGPLEMLDKVFRVLLKARAKRGAIDFETTETRMIFDENGKIERIVPEVRNDAHRLIEECMLAANVCASDFLQAHEQPALYRIHEGPREEKLDRLRTFLGPFGFTLGGGDEPTAKDYARLLKEILPRPDAQLLQTVMLRSLRQAVYSPDNVGHFGLAYEAYTHFTSPIRRYPDLLVHRAIKAVLDGEPFTPGDLELIGQHCSATERRADEATRDVVAWLKCYYMQDKIGEVYDGSVSSVVAFGLFVALDEVYVEGLVHVSDLGNDYFNFDAGHFEMRGERTGVRYRLSDRVRVQVVRVDLETTKIDFRLVPGEQPAPNSQPAAAPAEKTAAAAADPDLAVPVPQPARTTSRRAKPAAVADTSLKASKPVKPGRTSKETGKPAKPKPTKAGSAAAKAGTKRRKA